LQDRTGHDDTTLKQQEDIASAISAMSDNIMSAIIASDKLCIHQCRCATDSYRAATAKMQKSIAQIKELEETATGDLTGLGPMKAKLEQMKAKLEKNWEQKVIDYTCANLEERQRCAERVHFVRTVARTVGLDVRASVKALRMKLKDESWWQEVEGILEQETEGVLEQDVE
jgi:uncharacterized protein (UPF0335 family)